MAKDEYEFCAISLFDRNLGQPDEIRIVPLVADPTVGGVTAPIGTLGIRTNGVAHQKIGSGDTDWTVGASLGEPSGGGISETQHDDLDQLIHDIAETCYEEINYTSNNLDSIILWESISKTTKIREWLYTYSLNRISTETIKQYDGNGSLILGQTLTGTYNYSGNQLLNITWVKS